MIANVFLTFVDLFYIVFNVFLFARIISSWIVPDPRSNAFTSFLFDITEPILGPIRKLLPASQIIDLAPLAAFFLLQFAQWAAHALVAGL